MMVYDRNSSCHDHDTDVSGFAPAPAAATAAAAPIPGLFPPTGLGFRPTTEPEIRRLRHSELGARL